jgi:uncharacterized membrane protein YbhN (UPF0104 family)
MKESTARALRIAFVVVVAVVFARVVVQNADDLRHVDLTIRPAWLLLAAPLSLVVSALLPMAWRRLVLASGHHLDERRALRIWWMAQTFRYIPTGAAAVASRAVLTARESVPKAVTIATMAVELALIIAVSAIFSVVALPADSLASWARVLLVLLGVAGLAVGPFAVRWLSTRVPRLDPHRAGGWSVRELYSAEALVVANAAAKGVAFVALAAALVPVAGSDAVVLVGAFNAGVVLGMIGITPAGLGVREGVIAGILSSRYPLGDAAAVAVAWRAWELLFECVWLAIVQRKAFKSPGDSLATIDG